MKEYYPLHNSLFIVIVDKEQYNNLVDIYFIFNFNRLIKKRKYNRKINNKKKIEKNIEKIYEQYMQQLNKKDNNNNNLFINISTFGEFQQYNKKKFSII